MAGPGNPWEVLRYRTLDEMVTATKLNGCALTVQMLTTPEGWPASVMVGVESPRNKGVMEVFDRASSELRALGSPASQSNNPDCTAPTMRELGLTAQMIGSLRWVATAVHKGHKGSDIEACPNLVCSNILEILGSEW